MLGAISPRPRVVAAPAHGWRATLKRRRRQQRDLWPLPPPKSAVEDESREWTLTTSRIPSSTVCSSSSSSPSSENPPTNRRSALIAAGSIATATATLSAAAPARAIVSIPDPDSLLFDESDNEGLSKTSRNESGGNRVEAFEFVVPLRVVAPRGSVPLEWAADFRSALGRRATFSLEARPQVGDIMKELSSPEIGWESEREGGKAGAAAGGGGGGGGERRRRRRQSRHRSAATADAVCLSDEWLGLAVARGLVQPITGAQEQRWWKSLPRRWRSLCYRDRVTGRRVPLSDPRGDVFASPFRWGCTLVALRPGRLPRDLGGSGGEGSGSSRLDGRPCVVDWSDLLHPSLEGRVAFSDSPRDLLTAALGILGLPPSPDPERHAVDARALRGAVLALRRQALTFDGRDHARALASGDAIACVGSSADLLPLAMRSSAVSTSVPAGGTALWADLWCVPAFAGTSGSATARSTDDAFALAPSSSGASPLLPAWFELALTESRSERGRGLRGGGGASPLLLPPTIEERQEQLREEEEARRKRWWQVWKRPSSSSGRRLPPPLPSPDRAERARAALVVGGALPSTEVLSRSDFCVPAADEGLARAFREALRP